jgi:hypothetical protein
VYQAQKANIKPIHEKKKTLPCLSIGFRMGTLRAFLLTGLTSGVRQRSDSLKPILGVTGARSGAELLPKEGFPSMD